MYTTLTVKSFDNFNLLLSKFDFFYFNTSCKRTYAKTMKKKAMIDEICKDDIFCKIYHIWESADDGLITADEKDHVLKQIRLSLID